MTKEQEIRRQFAGKTFSSIHGKKIQQVREEREVYAGNKLFQKVVREVRR